MESALKVLAYIINWAHDFVIGITKVFGFNATDKDLHFWLLGMIGLIIFLITDFLFRRISRWNISVVSFIYTVTLLLVIAFSLEIEQKITGRGNMEFADIIAGLWGFLAIFGAYVLIRATFYYARKLYNKF
ncbi:hypothetical protein V6C32_07485 [Desulforamulus ruminis]|uniref:hypothetical protein n=1 Tax=Desulforamulus ruminis TaxID=1564 RepID=UPI002FDA5259